MHSARWAALAAVILVSPHLDAQTTFTSRSAFNAATSGLTTLTFDGIAPAGGYAVAPASIGGVAVTPVSGTPYVADPGFYFEYDYGTGAVFTPQGATTNVVRLILATPVTAFGIDFGSFVRTGVGTRFRFDLSTGYSTTVLQAHDRPVFDFFGVTSATPFTSVTLTSAAPTTAIYDNATFGTAATPSSVPEPATLALTAGGLLALGGAVRRRRRAI